MSDKIWTTPCPECQTFTDIREIDEWGMCEKCAETYAVKWDLLDLKEIELPEIG